MASCRCSRPASTAIARFSPLVRRCVTCSGVAGRTRGATGAWHLEVVPGGGRILTESAAAKDLWVSLSNCPEEALTPGFYLWHNHLCACEKGSNADTLTGDRISR